MNKKKRILIPAFVVAILIVIVIVISVSSQGGEAKITSMNAEEFAEALSNKNVFVIDTHIPEQKHISGTDAFIPYNELGDYKNLLPSNKNTPIAVYCRSGSMSKEAADKLKEMGYKTIYDLEGGKNAWESNGYELIDYQFETPHKLSDTATVYKSPTCTCCEGYVGYLNKEVNTNVVVQTEMYKIKEKYGIPSNLESCHTTIIDGYFIEGHVPFEAVEKMLNERPDILGIALPGMPSGSPGMPGTKEPFIVYQVMKNGSYSEYMGL